MFLIVIAANWHLAPREQLSPELSRVPGSIPGDKDLLLVGNVSTEPPPSACLPWGPLAGRTL